MPATDETDPVAIRKRDLRQQIRAALREIPSEARHERSNRILDFLASLEEYRDARTVLCFAGLALEPNLLGLFRLPSKRPRLVFPRVNGDALDLYEVSSPEALAKGAFGVREPMPEACERVRPEEIDLCLVPGAAFDPVTGARLGKGGGYYDRFLPFIRKEVGRIHVLGICYTDQLVKELPTQAHDIPVDAILSEDGIVRTESH